MTCGVHELPRPSFGEGEPEIWIVCGVFFAMHMAPPD